MTPKRIAGVNQVISVAKPDLWSIDSPRLYTVKIAIKEDNQIKDVTTSTFGIRSIRYNSNEGFLLNDKAIKLKGGCIHHENGLLGSMALDRAEERKVELLKNNGFNAVRCAHNPPSERFLETCDRLGLLVIDEFFDQWEMPKNPEDYHRFFDKGYRSDIESIVCRDRNHPSIIMWSIGNEIYEFKDSSCIQIARNIKSAVFAYDTTRPITVAVNNYWNKPNLSWSDGSNIIYSQVDIAGYNYEWNKYTKDHKLFPGRVIFGSESFPSMAFENWNLVEKYPS